MAERTKDKAPVVPASEWLEIVLHIVFVDETIVETSPNKLNPWAEHPFDVTFKGYDWRRTPKDELLQHDFDRGGVEVCYFPNTIHTSSTILREALGDAV